MKNLKVILTTLILLVSMSTFAQSDKFNYQAAIRDASGEIMENESVSIAFSIKSGSAVGTEVYAETHSVTTNDQGLVNLTIGSGIATSGTFANIDWSTNSHFLNVTIDGTDMGTSEFNSVPYANYAQEAMNANFATDAGVANQAVNSTYSDTASYGINLFSVDSIIRISHVDGDVNDIKTNSEGKLQIIPNGGNTPNVTFDDDGIRGVGIGTENPTEKLEVNGAIKVTEITSAPSPNTIYGNSTPIGYGSWANSLSNEYGITSITNTATGVYDVVLDNTIQGYPISIANAYGAPFLISTEYNVNTQIVTFKIYNNSGVLSNSYFNFVIFGRVQ